ncbi:helix-turn-helix transcriptional regulator [Bacillus sp. JJ1503]|uniref:helix-turn-helix transcriptional regulator n=1 Tax=Bacillus sp. JJ1503 TaxID=3122956 RepID=UPI002FFFA2B6
MSEIGCLCLVANSLNVHRSTISKCETGEIIPNYQTLLQLAKINNSEKRDIGSDTYILKKGPIDHDLDMIKKSLLELYNFDEKTKAQTIRVVQFLILGMKQK